MKTLDLELLFGKFVRLREKVAIQGVALNVGALVRDLDLTIDEFATLLKGQGDNYKEEVPIDTKTNHTTINMPVAPGLTHAEVWLRAWVGVCQTHRVTLSHAEEWADKCLRDFKKKFPEVKQ